MTRGPKSVGFTKCQEVQMNKKGKKTLTPKSRKLPAKVGKILNIHNNEGLLLMEGTVNEWRQWVKTRRT